MGQKYLEYKLKRKRENKKKTKKEEDFLGTKGV
jgi:hypothetical protein